MIKQIGLLLITLLLIGVVGLPVALAQCPCDPALPTCQCNDGILAGDMTGTAADDTLYNAGSVGGNMDGADGGDTLTNTGILTSMDGGTGHDTVTNAGQMLGGMTGDAGDDNLTNTSTGTIYYDMVGGTGNDTQSNAGTVERHMDGGDDDDSLSNTGSVWQDMHGGNGSDILTNEGQVGGSIYGAADNDTLINTGLVTGYMTGDDGDDTVVLQDGAVVGGIIDGGPDTDSLQFDFNVGPDLDRLSALIMAANPAGGSITINGNTYTWINFEQLVNLLHGDPAVAEAIIAMFGDGRLNPYDIAATAIVYCEAEGIHVYTPTGEFAFRVEAAGAQTADLGVVLADRLGVSLQSANDGLVTAFGPGDYAFTFEAQLCLP
jgi:hypothetical protein